jgi:hypothetical protein
LQRKSKINKHIKRLLRTFLRLCVPQQNFRIEKLINKTAGPIKNENNNNLDLDEFYKVHANLTKSDNLLSFPEEYKLPSEKEGILEELFYEKKSTKESTSLTTVTKTNNMLNLNKIYSSVLNNPIYSNIFYVKVFNDFINFNVYDNLNTLKMQTENAFSKVGKIYNTIEDSLIEIDYRILKFYHGKKNKKNVLY